MRILFALGVIGLILLEISLVYFIMPLPGSQGMRSIEAAYFIHRSRWILRAILWALVLVSAWSAWRVTGWRKWLVPASLLVVVGLTYFVNFQMSADRVFLQPRTLVMKPASTSKVAKDRLVVGIDINGDARAYPLQFIGYHHQVRDKVGGQEVLVSYCTVCRTGRVFSPIVNGRSETFRLVGMDHFNAMFEDRTTGSWWRQANGEAIRGPLKGMSLAEVPSRQTMLAQWLELHPQSLIMQGDTTALEKYAKDYAFERGTSRKKLTGTDTLSWRNKSWVLGVTVKGHSKAYDWNRLRRERVVNDEIGDVPIVLALAADDASFFAFERPDVQTRFALRGDSLVAGDRAYDLNGSSRSGELDALNVSQEFWHSWRTFHPGTERY
jgi:Protein of unknown function (DUF3179)